MTTQNTYPPQGLVNKNNGVRHTVKSSNTFAANDINLAVIIILLTNSKCAVGFCDVLDGGFDFAEDFFVKAADML